MFFLISKLAGTVNAFTFVGQMFSALRLALEGANPAHQPPVQAPGHVGAHNWNLDRIAWNLDRVAIPDQGVTKFL